jgi:hypothetical protein
MSLPLSNLSGHLTRIMSDIPVRFVWVGQEYQGVKSTPDLTQNLEVGGLDEKVDFQIFVKKDSLPSVPEIGQIMTVEGRKMRVNEVRRSPDNENLISLQMASARTR